MSKKVSKKVQSEIAKFLKNDPTIKKIHFRYTVGKRPYHIHSGDYWTIGARVENGAILVVEESIEKAGKTGGGYNGSFDRLTLQFPQSGIGNDSAKGVVVHEVTHAIMDMQAWEEIDFIDYEACAYIADKVWESAARQQREFIYDYLAQTMPALTVNQQRELTTHTYTPGQKTAIDSSPRYQRNAKLAGAIHDAARDIVRMFKLTERGDVRLDSNHAAVVKLKQALRKHPIYSRRAGTKAWWNDGIYKKRPHPLDRFFDGF